MILSYQDTKKKKKKEIQIILYKLFIEYGSFQWVFRIQVTEQKQNGCGRNHIIFDESPVPPLHEKFHPRSSLHR